jgi:RNA polymerase sigma factor (TIGR02999 family)
MSDVTRILSQIDRDDPGAAGQLLPLVYAELRRLAAAKLAYEQPGQTLQATALVHEAYMRLVGPPAAAGQPLAPSFSSRRHFFAAAAEAMRRILIDNARTRGSLKHGGKLRRQTLDDVPADEAADIDELLALDDALSKLVTEDPVAAQLVNLRYFAGLTMDQAAETLEISPRTAYYTWNYARAWLRKAVCGNEPEKTRS